MVADDIKYNARTDRLNGLLVLYAIFKQLQTIL